MIDLSIVIPAHNEEGVIEQTVRELDLRITWEGIVYEIVVVNDNSTDQTGFILEELRQEIQNLKVVDNPPPYGFGFAVSCGIEEKGGKHIAIMMADASDDPEDLICFFRKSEAEGVDAVFGNRFAKGGGGCRLSYVKIDSQSAGQLADCGTVCDTLHGYHQCFQTLPTGDIGRTQTLPESPIQSDSRTSTKGNRERLQLCGITEPMD